MKHTTKIEQRTLYECSHARVEKDVIYCRKGHVFSKRPNDGKVEVMRLARGDRLAFRVCQDCADFDCMGPPLLRAECGWLRKEAQTDGDMA